VVDEAVGMVVVTWSAARGALVVELPHAVSVSVERAATPSLDGSL